jgi:bifunctional isochorismate lyase/aryl carrier protein
MAGIPRIVSYALPTEEELPATRATWQVDRNRAALLIHDMQNYFVNAFAGGEPIATVIANIASLRRHCDRVGVPVFYTAQTGSQDPRDRGLQRHLWGPGMSADRGQPSIVEALTPEKEHFVLTKWRYSAFQRSTLEHLLRARGRDQLVVCGVFAHVGCTLTAADAFMRDIEPFIVADGVADFSREKHDMAIAYAAECFARPMTTEHLVKEI